MVSTKTSPDQQTQIAGQYFLEGQRCQKNKYYPQAEQAYKTALQYNPNHGESWHFLGILYMETDRLQEAEPHLSKAAQLLHNQPDVWSNYGICLDKLKRHEDAIKIYQHALSIQPNHLASYANMALALRSLGKLQESVDMTRFIIKRDPDNASLWYNLSQAYTDMEDFDQAEKALFQSIKLNGSPGAYYNLAHILLRRGEYRDGFAAYEYRWQCDELANSRKRIPKGEVWAQQDVRGKTLLVFTEQGVGDEVIFTGFLKAFKAYYGCDIVITCDDRMQPLFARSYPDIQVVGHDGYLEGKYGDIHIDYICPMGSIPYRLTKINQFAPRKEPYLVIDEDKKDNFRKTLKKKYGDKPVIGISWFTVNWETGDERRIDADFFVEKLQKIDGIFVNLQYGEWESQCYAPAKKYNVIMHRFTEADPMKDMDSFASVVGACDCVLSIVSANVHISGAIGVPCFVVMPPRGRWSYPHTLGHSPWYKDVRFFRRQKDDDWHEAMDNATSAICGWYQREFGKVIKFGSESIFKDEEERRQTTSHIINQVIELTQNDKNDDAIALVEDLLAKDPENLLALYNYGVLMNREGKNNLAMSLAHRILGIAPDHYRAHQLIATIYNDRGDSHGWGRTFQALHALYPDDPRAFYSCGIYALATSNYALGWIGYEQRFAFLAQEHQTNKFGRPDLKQWNGRPLGDHETLLIQKEQGIGDQIMFFPLVAYLPNKVKNIYLSADKRFHPLYQRVFPWLNLIDHKDVVEGRVHPEDFTEQVANGSIASIVDLFGKTPKWWGSYLIDDYERTAQFREMLEQRFGDKPICGISWYSRNMEREYRIIPIDEWRKILTAGDIGFVNLQYGEEAKTLQNLADELGVDMITLDDPDPLVDLDGFVSLIKACDMVVSISNSTVHLAAALGVPTWVIIQSTIDWRWQIDVKKIDWYPSMRLYRQKSQNDWSGIMQEVFEDLRHWASLGEYDLSIDEGDQKITIDPNIYPDAKALHEKAMTLKKIGDFENALVCVDALIARHKAISQEEDYTFLNDRAYLLMQLSNHKEAEKCYATLLRVIKDNAALYVNYGACLQNLGQTTLAAKQFKQAVKIEPNMPQAHYNLAVEYAHQGKIKDAFKHYDLAIEVDPNFQVANYNRGLLQLKIGQYREGWKNYEWRQILTENAQYYFPGQQWQGEDLGKGKLLIYAEQGIGDQIMFANMMELIKDKTKDITLSCWELLQPLFAESFPWARVIAHRDFSQGKVDPDSFSAKLPIGSIAHLTNLFDDTKISGNAFMKAPKIQQKIYRQELERRYGSKKDGVKFIGLSWYSYNTERGGRSIDVAEWEKILTVRDDIVFVNLQYGEWAMREIHNKANELGVKMHTFWELDSRENLVNFAGLISALDGVITISNATVHFAGALGVPCYLLLNQHADWRWFDNTDKSLWYSSLRLLRQKQEGKWRLVMDNLADKLASKELF